MRYIESHHINHFTKKNPQGQNKKNINKWGMIVNPEYLTAPKKRGGGVKIHFKIITINITNMTYYPYKIKK